MSVGRDGDPIVPGEADLVGLVEGDGLHGPALPRQPQGHFQVMAAHHAVMDEMGLNNFYYALVFFFSCENFSFAPAI